MMTKLKATMLASLITLAFGSVAVANPLSWETEETILLAKSGGDRFMAVDDPTDPNFDVAIVDEMMSQAMYMVQVGLMAMQSSNPEIKAMGEAMLNQANAEIAKLSALRDAVIKARIGKANN
ncbi:MAG: hypothetical protein NW237_07090 [Cyanobacteriota bacterium]|nr:hypothetical protein [Cyanobacteriota bacterium]